MGMTEIPLNENNMKLLNSILDNGCNGLDANDQPSNINQVISFLLNVADVEGYLKSATSELLSLIEKEDRTVN